MWPFCQLCLFVLGACTDTECLLFFVVGTWASTCGADTIAGWATHRLSLPVVLQEMLLIKLLQLFCWSVPANSRCHTRPNTFPCLTVRLMGCWVSSYKDVFFLLGYLFLVMPVLTVIQGAWASVLMFLSCCLWVWNLVSFPERRANLGPLFAHRSLHVVESWLYRIVYLALIPGSKNPWAIKFGTGGPYICGPSVGVELTSCHPSWRIEFWSGA